MYDDDYEVPGDWDGLYEEDFEDDYELDLDDYETNQDVYLIRNSADADPWDDRWEF